MKRKQSNFRLSRLAKKVAVMVLTVFLTCCSVSALEGSAEVPQEGVRAVIPGGTPFGVRFYTEGAVVYRVEEGSAAARAGILPGDIIKAIDGESVGDTLHLSELIGQKKGCYMVELSRGEEILQLKISPEAGKEELLGVYARDMLAGIGTLTFIVPENAAFGGLGHGICEGKHGTLLPLSKGTLCDVRLTSVSKGEKGAPGQLRGMFTAGNIGTVTKNTNQGIFGYLGIVPKEKAVAVALEEEIKPGHASILCTVADGKKGEYEIEIEKILSFDGEQRNFLLKVTDPTLLEQTGGIVQGMSGSPILQDGKIVGAVTHVLVDDPTRGYGIYIGNMLKMAE